MPKYKELFESDLVWNEIRRTAEARIRLRSSHAVARAKNEILPRLQEEYEAAILDDGTVLEIGPGVDKLIDEVWEETFGAASA